MTTSRALNKYLRGPHFRRRLAREYRNYEILAEAGLRTAVARALKSKLRKLGGTASQYTVVCEPHLPNPHVVPDILIFKGKRPRIWIELKDTGTFDPKRAESDWRKLREFCPKYPSVKTGYLIYVARTGKNDFPVQRTRKTLRLWPVPIVLEDVLGCDFDEWVKEYRRRAHYVIPSRPKARAASA